MTNDNTFVRSLHDLGAAGWFGSGLMAAVVTTAQSPTSTTRSRLVVSPTGCVVGGDPPTPHSSLRIATDDTPDHIAGGLKQQSVFQWLIPAWTAGIIARGALQGVQQRPSRVEAGTLDRLNRVS